jgi:hypothetical protein
VTGKRQRSPKEGRMEVPVDQWVPPRKSERAIPTGQRGRSVQTFLTAEERVAFNRWLNDADLSVQDGLKWLILDAIQHHRMPPGR